MPISNVEVPFHKLLKRFALIYLPAVIIFSIILLVGIRFDEHSRVRDVTLREASRVKISSTQAEQDLSVMDTDMRLVARLPLLSRYLNSGSPAQRDELENIFLHISQQIRRYDQIRYLDANGQEVIRINYNDGMPAIVPREQLQNKADRYYFSDTIKLNQGERFLSPLDLNIEHGKLEIPYKPTIRFGTPVFDSAGHKKGIIVLNYLANTLLQDVQTVMQGGMPHSFMLLNRDGYWLKSGNSEDEWGFMLGKKERTFGHDFPAAWRAISAAEQGSLLTDQGLFVYGTIYPLRSMSTNTEQAHEANEHYWKAVSFVPRNDLFGNAIYHQPLGRILLVITYLLLGLVSFFVARIVLSREQAQMALRDKSERLQAVLDTVVDGIITIDERGIVESITPSAEHIFGYAASEVIGHNIKMLMPEPYHSQHDGYIEHYRATGEARIIGTGREVTGQRKDGSTFPMELSVSRMQLGDDLHFTGIVRDITERAQAVENIQGLTERLRLANQTAGIGIWGWDVVRSHLVWDETMYKLYGLEPEQFSGTYEAWLKCVHPEDADRADEAIQLALRDVKPYDIVFRVIWPNGEVRWLKAMGTVQRDASAKPLRMIGTNADITELKNNEQSIIAAKEQAELANLTKDSFLATMSHEIRTPLGGMMGMLELLGYTPLNDEQRDTLQVARESGQSLLRIVNDILDWSKIEAGKLGISPQPTSLSQLVAGVVNTYARVASANSLILEHHVDARLSPAHIVDPLRLAQVLNNFVSNALKFTRKGRVDVQAELLGAQDGVERVRFSVKDTGAGIEKDVQARLFRNYSQESVDTARMYGGTGLGLAICRKLADLMGGQIELVSAPGMGSTFSITLDLPVTATTPTQAPATPSATEAVPIQSRGKSVVKADAPTVLVVDDHPVNRKLLVIQLGLLGLRGEPAENGEAALAMWRNGQFALIITDCHMPKMDGYELARTIRKIEADNVRPRTPIFAWTANALAGEVERCRAAGMDELLVKPADLAQLKEALSRWLAVADTPVRAAHEEPDDAAPIDLKVLDQLTANATDRAAILQDFMAQTRSDLADLLAALEAHDLPASVRTAHRMKGASRMVGAYELTSACEAMENAARQGNPESADTLKAALESLEAHLAKVAGTINGGTSNANT